MKKVSHYFLVAMGLLLALPSYSQSVLAQHIKNGTKIYIYSGEEVTFYFKNSTKEAGRFYIYSDSVFVCDECVIHDSASLAMIDINGISLNGITYSPKDLLILKNGLVVPISKMELHAISDVTALKTHRITNKRELLGTSLIIGGSVLAGIAIPFTVLIYAELKAIDFFLGAGFVRAFAPALLIYAIPIATIIIGNSLKKHIKYKSSKYHFEIR